MPRILIIEDDPAIVSSVRKTLTLDKAYELIHLPQPEKALAAVQAQKPDIILLDILMPGTDGRLILKSLKEDPATASVPVILLTGLSSEGDKVLGLSLGADDYVTKPFGAMELLARIQAVLRRFSRHPAASKTDAFTVAGLRLDPASGEAAYKGKALKLQPREFEVLRLLASQPGRVLTRTYLIENASTYGMAVPTRSVDTHIKNIRRKLGSGAALIETIPKRGYRFAAPDA
ncbi:MAG: response regulator transcription factor [Elusimicrobia bacterium]|nr:response regulator transcription factor [Elusimicrobiota bacterium]